MLSTRKKSKKPRVSCKTNQSRKDTNQKLLIIWELENGATLKSKGMTGQNHQNSITKKSKNTKATKKESTHTTNQKVHKESDKKIKKES